MGHDNTDKVSEVVHSNMFWAYTDLILHTGNVIKHFTLWFNSCPCHPSSHVPPGRSQTCPMVGRRAPAMANGTWLEGMEHYWQREEVRSIAMTQGLLPNERDLLMNDWIAAKSHVSMSLQLKFAFWSCLPWRLCGMADLDLAKARAAAMACISLWDSSRLRAADHHPLSIAILSPGLCRDEVARFAFMDESLDKLPHLQTHVARLFLVPLVERSIEAKHACAKLALCGSGFRANQDTRKSSCGGNKKKIQGHSKGYNMCFRYYCCNRHRIHRIQIHLIPL